MRHEKLSESLPGVLCCPAPIQYSKAIRALHRGPLMHFVPWGSEMEKEVYDNQKLKKKEEEEFSHIFVCKGKVFDL